MPLEISHKEITPATAVITLAGRLTLGPAGEQVQALVGDLLARGKRNLIFDVTGITHIDSTGIGRFIYSYNKVTQAGGTLRIVGAAGPVRDGFHVTRLDTVFKFYSDIESACAGLA